MKTMILFAALSVALATAAAPLPDPSADERAFYGTGSFAFCRLARQDEARLDEERERWKSRRAQALREVEARRPITDPNLDLSRFDLDAWLLDELFTALVEELFAKVADDVYEELREVAAERKRILREFGPALREIAGLIARDVIGRDPRSVMMESRIRTVYLKHLGPMLRRMEASMKPSIARILLKSATPEALVGFAADVLVSWAEQVGGLMVQMYRTEQWNRAVIEVELRYTSQIMSLSRQKHEAQRVVAMACRRGATVNARMPFTRTDTWVDAGECVRIAPVGDQRITWTRHRGVPLEAGPEGTDPMRLGGGSPSEILTLLGLERRPLPSAPPGALLAAIVPDEPGAQPGEPFLVGAGGFFTMPEEGLLVFLINDAHLANNAGAFRVEFQPAPSYGACK